MVLKCHCGCNRELRRTKQFGSDQPSGYQCVGTTFDRNKRFYDDECRKKWEGQRRGPVLATVNGHNTHDFDVVNTQAERMF